ncbi:hypothetical protein ES705_32586 [subsurface metagenome]|jgi:hypothetical protein
MEEKKLDRLRVLTRRVSQAGGRLSALTPEESRELERLLREKISEEEFGWPASGED